MDVSPVEIVFEDSFCLVVNKPNDLLVHHSYYARNIEEDSLAEILRQQGKTAYPVHRLDRKTSGLILFAKEKEYVPAFQALFEENKISKKYLALLRGHLPESGIIDSPVKNDRGNYKEALTHYICLQHIELPIPVEPYETSRYSLVEFFPQTGRMHQLRIHANKISHPIIGDPKYGNRHHNHMFIEKFGISQLFLHAASLTFIHPFTKEEIAVSAPLPEFWNAIL
ncbi:MAG: pseudouridine synthase [Crocinitomicaceae bacterium]|jgi:tRNA pseudouridine65 synthase|nr:pseudouridine synthase [Crocinitomicaceae bacterium]